MKKTTLLVTVALLLTSPAHAHDAFDQPPLAYASEDVPCLSVNRAVPHVHLGPVRHRPHRRRVAPKHARRRVVRHRARRRIAHAPTSPPVCHVLHALELPATAFAPSDVVLPELPYDQLPDYEYPDTDSEYVSFSSGGYGELAWGYIFVPGGSCGPYGGRSPGTTVSAAPEPATWSLLLLGVSLVGARWRSLRRLRS